MESYQWTPKVEVSDEMPLDPKDWLLKTLDRIEARVEEFRRQSLRLEEYKDHLFISLETIRSSPSHFNSLGELSDTDKDDIERYFERVVARCSTVEITVRTDRDKQQEEALSDVNKLIDHLVISFKSDPENCMIRCQSYLAACKDEPEVTVDKKFESALLGCALDDQKRVKKRLYGLLDYLEHGRFTFVTEWLKDDTGISLEAADFRTSSSCYGVSPPAKRRKEDSTSTAESYAQSLLERQQVAIETLGRKVHDMNESINQLTDELGQIRTNYEEARDILKEAYS